MRKGGFRLPLQLTKEMKLALTKICAKLDSPSDFPIALRIFRVGLLVYEGLSTEEMRKMYLRRTST